MNSRSRADRLGRVYSLVQVSITGATKCKSWLLTDALLIRRWFNMHALCWRQAYQLTPLTLRLVAHLLSPLLLGINYRRVDLLGLWLQLAHAPTQLRASTVVKHRRSSCLLQFEILDGEKNNSQYGEIFRVSLTSLDSKWWQLMKSLSRDEFAPWRGTSHVDHHQDRLSVFNFHTRTINVAI